MTPLDIAHDLLSRLDLRTTAEHWVFHEEICTWPATAQSQLQGLGLLTGPFPLQRAACTECEEPHSELVRFLDIGDRQRAFIPCGTHGRIFLEPEQLIGWKAETSSVITKLGVALKTGTMARSLVADRCWDLGMAGIVDHHAPVLLLRGTGWPDAKETFTGLAAQNAAVWLTLTPVIRSLLGVRMVPLTHLLRWLDDALSYDFTALGLRSVRSEMWLLSRGLEKHQQP